MEASLAGGVGALVAVPVLALNNRVASLSSLWAPEAVTEIEGGLVVARKGR